MPSRFNHDEHSKKFGCKECHPKLFLMKAGSAHITMQELNNGAYCGDCHNGRKAFPASACARCHNTTGGYDKDLVYKVDGMGPVTFSHAFHSSAFSCEKCHPKIFAMKKTQGKMTMESMNNGKHCGACHNGTVATAVTDCAKCHK
jgi:c(7)-type cytochrome triheme protein